LYPAATEDSSESEGHGLYSAVTEDSLESEGHGLYFAVTEDSPESEGAWLVLCRDRGFVRIRGGMACILP
jgi:hypothetical protein